MMTGRRAFPFGLLLPLILFSLASFLPGRQVEAADSFSESWHDGRAEIDGYRLTVDRYGQHRSGQAVMIYVTEPFRLSTRVKADDPARDPGDITDVLKLNLVRDFQTGIYDYNTMTSIFCESSDFSPLKISFTSSEWYGQVYSESIFEKNLIELTVHSYFERDSATVQLDRPQGGLTGEELFIKLRGLKGNFLAPGTVVKIPFLPSSFVRRLTHRDASWIEVEISRDDQGGQTIVPAGTFPSITYRVQTSSGRSGFFDVEASPPHRILRWSLPPDIEGILTGSLRTPYWKKNYEGGEQLLEQLGLQPLMMN